jgi:hypothetical protein
MADPDRFSIVAGLVPRPSSSAGNEGTEKFAGMDGTGTISSEKKVNL